MRIADAINRLQTRLHDAGQIIRDLRGGENLGIKAHIHERIALARLFHDNRIIGFAAAQGRSRVAAHDPAYEDDEEVDAKKKKTGDDEDGDEGEAAFLLPHTHRC